MMYLLCSKAASECQQVGAASAQGASNTAQVASCARLQMSLLPQPPFVRAPLHGTCKVCACCSPPAAAAACR